MKMLKSEIETLYSLDNIIIVRFSSVGKFSVLVSEIG